MARAGANSTPKVYGYGHIGAATRVREYEDRHFADTIQTQGGLQLTLAIVSDGVGGGSLGQRAAQLTVDSIVMACQDSAQTDIPQLLGESIGAANRRVHAEAQANQDRQQMSATVAIAAIVDGRLYVANVGDSRVYLIRDKRVIQVTVDHTWTNDRVREGRLRPEDAERHPNAHIITRSVGYRPQVRVDLGLYLQRGAEGGEQAYRQQGLQLKKTDQILVCSDGLIKPIHTGEGYYVNRDEIRETIRRYKPERAAKTLVDLAVSRYADDNVTAVVVEMPGRKHPFAWLPRVQIGIPALAILGVTICGLIVTGALVFPSLFDRGEVVPIPEPGYALIMTGQVKHRSPLRGEQILGENGLAPFGPESVLLVESGVAKLSLPGAYVLMIAGNAENPARLELLQEGIPNQVDETIVRLKEGRVFVYSARGSSDKIGVVVETLSGRARMQGTIMGVRFDAVPWLMNVDCVLGKCSLETNRPATLALLERQGGWVDSSGEPRGPGPMDLAAYTHFPLSDFIPEDVIRDLTATYLPSPTSPVLAPTHTATPTPTATFTPTIASGGVEETRPPEGSPGFPTESIATKPLPTGSLPTESQPTQPPATEPPFPTAPPQPTLPPIPTMGQKPTDDIKPTANPNFEFEAGSPVSNDGNDGRVDGDHSTPSTLAPDKASAIQLIGWIGIGVIGVILVVLVMRKFGLKLRVRISSRRKER